MRLRGAIPSPRHRLASAMPHRIAGDTPVQFLWKPVQLSYWGNETDGDCVTAEECFGKSCGPSGVFIPDATAIAWATKNGFLNGATLIDVLDLMQTGGFLLNGQTYDDGPCNSVDWTNEAVLQNAIVQGPVKIGVAADQLENVVPDPPTNGWLAIGFTPDSNEDHCVSLCGYGTVGWLASKLGVDPPLTLTPHSFEGAGLSNAALIVDYSAPAYALFTWSSVGIIDVPSLQAICSEAWIRTPTTVVKA